MLRTSCLVAFLVLCLCNLRAADSIAPLADAIQQQKTTQIEELLAQKVDVNAPQVDGMTPLHWAVYHEQERATERLLSAGANPNAQNRYGVPPLSLACASGNAKIVELLLTAGADAKATIRGGESMLMAACRTGKLAPVQSLIAHGADVNARERQGQTALMWAAADGHVEVVEALIREGADRFALLESGFTPLLFAIRNGHTQVVLRLLDSGVDVNSVVSNEKSTGKGPKPGTTPLLLAVENGHFDLAITLLRAGADPNERRRGYTPIHAMTWVRKPLRGDGDPPPIGSGKMTSLEFVRALVSHGADVNALHGQHKPNGGALNKTKATAFLLAAETGDVPLMKLLLELGADPKLVNVDHCTPLLAATGVGILSNGDESAGTEDDAIEAVKLLLDSGADINSVDDGGNSALHGAVYENRSKLIEYLTDHGADISIWNRPNKRGWTPLDIAQGHRPGNFRLAPESIEVLKRLLRAAGIEPPPARPRS
ncbi:MAG: ankyrin repeat domain-containing protein [Pirellula sp.]